MKLSRITLGTAQLTSSYGVANTKVYGPSPESALSLLSLAYDAGITAVDTAPAYSESESAIGRFIAEQDAKDLLVCTKLPSAVRQGIPFNEIGDYVVQSFRSSLAKLGRVNYYLLHDGSDLIKYGSHLEKALRSIKESGLVDHLGVSVYDTEELELFDRYPLFEAVQFPANLFDHRFLSEPVGGFILERGLTAFCRSVYLQGLFLLPPESSCPQASHARCELLRLHDFSKDRGWDADALALAFVSSFSHIGSMVIGMETAEQVLRNVENLKRSLPEEIRHELLFKFGGVADTIRDPRRWGS